MASWSALRTLSRMFLILCAQHSCRGDVWVDGGQCGQEALAAVGADYLDPLAGEAAAIEIDEEALSLGGAFAPRQAEVDDLFPAVGPDAKRHQDRPSEGAGAGLAGEHHAVTVNIRGSSFRLKDKLKSGLIRAEEPSQVT